MLGRFLRRALGTRQRIHPVTEERTTDDAGTRDEYTPNEDTSLSRAAQLRLLRSLNIAGVTINEVMTMLDRSTAPDAAGRSENSPDEGYKREVNCRMIRGTLIFKLLRRKKYAKSSGSCEESCCICQEDYEGGDEVAVLRCRHKFHARCIATWLVQRNVCPVCQKRAISLARLGRRTRKNFLQNLEI